MFRLYELCLIDKGLLIYMSLVLFIDKELFVYKSYFVIFYTLHAINPLARSSYK